MARRILAKDLSAREAVAAHLKQIERVNPKVNAIVTLVAEQAMARAAEADEKLARGKPVGPLHGLPIAHKDLQPTSRISFHPATRSWWSAFAARAPSW
jgi:amidase